MKKVSISNFKTLVKEFFTGKLKIFSLCFLLSFLISNHSIARKIYSTASGNWTSTASWNGGIVPIAGDTVIIQTGHTITVNSNLYSNSTYMFLIIVGTLDLANNGKMSFSASSKIIIETGGRILGDSNGDQISIGTGTSEYRGGVQGNITGPAYINNGHNPVSGEGTGGCGCYTPGSIPLPIKLAWFKGSVNKLEVKLDWATASEENFDYFDLQRSENGIEFHSISILNGNGGKDKLITYSYIDHLETGGRYYYRLKSVDIDRSFEYSKIIAVTSEGYEEIGLMVYPNPTFNQNHFYINGGVNPSQMILYDQLGKPYLATNLKPGKNEIPLDPSIPNGIYVVKLMGNSTTQSTKLIIAR